MQRFTENFTIKKFKNSKFEEEYNNSIYLKCSSNIFKLRKFLYIINFLLVLSSFTISNFFNYNNDCRIKYLSYFSIVNLLAYFIFESFNKDSPDLTIPKDKMVPCILVYLLLLVNSLNNFEFQIIYINNDINSIAFITILINVFIKGIINTFVIPTFANVIKINLIVMTYNWLIVMILSDQKSYNYLHIQYFFNFLVICFNWVDEYINKKLFYCELSKSKKRMKIEKFFDFLNIGHFKLINGRIDIISNYIKQLIFNDFTEEENYSIKNLDSIVAFPKSIEGIPEVLNNYFHSFKDNQKLHFENLINFIITDNSLIKYYSQHASIGLYKIKKSETEETIIKIYIKLKCKQDSSYNNNNEIIVEGIVNDVSQYFLKSENQYNSLVLAKYIHDFKSPIFLLNEILNKHNNTFSNEYNYDCLATFKQYSLYIKVVSKYIIEMVHSINDFSKLQLNHNFESNKELFKTKDKVNIRKLIKFCIDFYRIVIICGSKSNINIYSKIDDNVPLYILINKRALKQVIMNLLSNSYKFTYRGEIKITCSIMSDSNNEEYIKISVIDTGVGISEDVIHKLYKPFNYSTSKNQEGSGLGICIVKDFLRSINSDLQIKSVTNKGSEFSFKFSLTNPTSNILNEESSSFISIIKNVNNRTKSHLSNSIFNEKNSININDNNEPNNIYFDYQSSNNNNEDLNTETRFQDYIFQRTDEDVKELNYLNFDDLIDKNNLSKISSKSIKSFKEIDITKYNNFNLFPESKRNISKFHSSHSLLKHDEIKLKYRVLILDDDINFLKSIARQIEKIKCELVYTLQLDYKSDPIDGLYEMYSNLKNKNLYYDLIITDEHMPFLYGSSFVDFYKRNLQNNGFYKVPFILFSSEEDQFNSSIFDGSIKKPCTKDRIQNLLNTYLKH